MSKKMSNETVSKEDRCCQICQTDFESGFITLVRIIIYPGILANISLNEGAVDMYSVENVWMPGSSEETGLVRHAVVP